MVDHQSSSDSSTPDSNKPVENASQVTTTSQPKQTAKQTNNAKFPIFQWFLFLLVLAVIAGSGYLWLQVQHISQDLLKASRFELSQQQQVQTNNDLSESLEKARSQLAENQQTIESLNTELSMLKSRIAGISGVNRVDWLVDEVQHLTRLAHQRLVLSHDAQGAIALLKAADQVVIEMRQSEALPIRQAIADDLLELRLAAEVDLEGAYIRLDTLSKKLEELHFRQPNYPSQGALIESNPEEMNIPYESQTIDEQMSGALAHILNKLQPYLFRSFRIDANVKPLLSSNEREYLSRNMLLAIEEAQLALLRREPESYRLSLEQSEKWIQQYYDSSDPVTSSVLAIIEELKSYRLNPDMPEIDSTLSAVKAFAQNWQEQKVNRQQLKRSLSQ